MQKPGLVWSSLICKGPGPSRAATSCRDGSQLALHGRDRRGPRHRIEGVGLPAVRPPSLLFELKRRNRFVGTRHGTNERLSIEGHADMIRFYRRLMENAGGMAPPRPALAGSRRAKLALRGLG